MKILIFGANGMLGRYISVYLTQVGYNVIPITRATYDISSNDNDKLEMIIRNFSPQLVINCTGITNKRSEISRTEMYLVNAVFPHILGIICEKACIKFIHPTTDCVFSGSKGNYSETDNIDCTDDYGISKSIGEVVPSACVIRVSIIGESNNDKSSLIEWLKAQKSCCGYTNHFWNGITCLEYAKMIQEMIQEDNFWKGIKHIRSSETVTKHWLVTEINRVFNLDVNITEYQTEQKYDRSLSGEPRKTSLSLQLKELVEFSKYI